jgi:hypothetical protein
MVENQWCLSQRPSFLNERQVPSGRHDWIAYGCRCGKRGLSESAGGRVRGWDSLQGHSVDRMASWNSAAVESSTKCITRRPLRCAFWEEPVGRADCVVRTGLMVLISRPVSWSLIIDSELENRTLRRVSGLIELTESIDLIMNRATLSLLSLEHLLEIRQGAGIL